MDGWMISFLKHFDSVHDISLLFGLVNYLSQIGLDSEKERGKVGMDTNPPKKTKQNAYSARSLHFFQFKLIDKIAQFEYQGSTAPDQCAEWSKS